MMMLDDDERTNGRQQVIAWAYVHNWVLPCNRLALLRKPGSFTIYFSTIQFSSFFFFSPVSLKQSPAATAAAGAAAAMQWPEDATRVNEASKA